MLAKQSLNLDTILYRVQPGDSLNKIINNYYGKVSLQQRNDIIATIQADNPKLKNPGRIQANQLLQIDIPPQYCAAPRAQKLTPLLNIDKALLKPLQQQYQAANPKEKSFLKAMTPYMLLGASASSTMVDKTFQTNAPLVARVAELYNDYKANNITKGQYDSGRKALLSKLATNLGYVNKLLNGDKLPNEVIRISRTKGSVPTKNITQQVAKMGKLSKLSSAGGIILSAVSLGVGCVQVANTDNLQEKNEIIVETLTNVGVGSVYAFAATVILISTPVGWIAALAIGLGGVALSSAAGITAKYFYTSSGSKVNLNSNLGVNHLCK